MRSSIAAAAACDDDDDDECVYVCVLFPPLLRTQDTRSHRPAAVAGGTQCTQPLIISGCCNCSRRNGGYIAGGVRFPRPRSWRRPSPSQLTGRCHAETSPVPPRVKKLTHALGPLKLSAAANADEFGRPHANCGCSVAFYDVVPRHNRLPSSLALCPSVRLSVAGSLPFSECSPCVCVCVACMCVRSCHRSIASDGQLGVARCFSGCPSEP